MRKIINITLAAFALLSVASCRHYDKVAGDPMQTRMYTLDNGLKVYMSVNREEPRIQTYIAVKVGGKNDPSETTGLAHYFEHLMFKGSESFGTSDYAAEKPMLDQIEALFENYRQTSDPVERNAIYHQIDSISYEASKIAIPNEYDKLMAMIGADGTNAWTSSDETVYVEDIPSNQIDNWARIQADRFRHNVIRGFHTELETIYEEKNMSLTQDNRKLWEALDAGLFPNHPYGKQTVLGTQEHLKNPSITNVKKYHDTYYVPNNIAICVAGDFNPDEMVAAIEKYFGDWEPNPEIPTLEFEPEQPISEPLVKDVYGLEAEMLALGWRLPGARDIRNSAIAEIAGSILYNGQAGLMDLDINQQQKAMFVYAGSQIQPDYSTFLAMGQPKQGQTLEELRSLILEEVSKLSKGDFNEELITSTINNIRLSKMKMLESNQSRAQMFVNAFINGIEWKDVVNELNLYSSITKADVMAWAEEFIGSDNYVVVNKRQGVDSSVQKISAPSITPIVTNRDMQSEFLTSVKDSQVKPIEPVYVNFKKEMDVCKIRDGISMLYKKNTLNDVFNISYVFNTGTENDPELSLACDYLPYLGTEEMSAEEIASRMYSLACDMRVSAGANQTTITISGLAENMKEAMTLVEALINGAKADENVLAGCKSDLFKSRIDAKKSQRSCYSALTRYVTYGQDFITRNTMSNETVAAVTSEELLNKVRSLYTKGHEVLYYGPASESEVKDAVNATHKTNGELTEMPEVYPSTLQTPSNTVVMAQYDAKQIYYLQHSDRGESFDAANAPAITLYNEYFGGGMNSIVFQEMREARGLAYSANARLRDPASASGSYSFSAFIATQNDKMRQAIEAFDDIINNMPESEAAFEIAKESLLGRLRTQRTTGQGILWAYRQCRRYGLSEPTDRDVFEKVQNMTLADVKATQQEWIKGRSYTYTILGDIKDLDTDFLKTLGPVKVVSLEEIFGF